MCQAETVSASLENSEKLHSEGVPFSFFSYHRSCRSQVKFDHYASWVYLEETGGLVERERNERDRNERDRNELCEGYEVTMPAMTGALPGRLGDVLF